jgi:endogenous inhibitor of DNA gyrase (YacG/DUF329 family)
VTTVTCPNCQRKVEWSDASPYRPFCSRRCQLLDLGAWLQEQRKIPGEPVPSGIDDESSPDGEPSPPRH